MDIKSNIKKLKYNGTIHIWKYRKRSKDYPGWNVAMDLNATNYCIELIDLMKRSIYKINHPIVIEKASLNQIRVPYTNTELRDAIRPNKLYLKYDPKLEANHFAFLYFNNFITISFDLQKLIEFEDILKNRKMHQVEYEMYGEGSDSILYFWNIHD